MRKVVINSTGSKQLHTGVKFSAHAVETRADIAEDRILMALARFAESFFEFGALLIC